MTSLSGNNVTPTTDVSSNSFTIATSEANNNIAAVRSTSSSPSKSFENKSNQANSRVNIGKPANTINSLESKGTVFNGNIPNNSNNTASSISAEKGVS